MGNVNPQGRCEKCTMCCDYAIQLKKPAFQVSAGMRDFTSLIFETGWGRRKKLGGWDMHTHFFFKNIVCFPLRNGAPPLIMWSPNNFLPHLQAQNL